MSKDKLETEKQGGKGKELRGSIKRIWGYIGRFKSGLVLVILCTVMGTVFNTVGPKILSRATTALFEGLTRKVAGTGGIDFGLIGRILLVLLGLYLVSALFSALQGMVMADVSQKFCYRLRKELAEKINRMPLGYFESGTVGEVLSRITNDVDTLGEGISQSITQIVSAVATLIGVLVMMLSISPLMTLIALVTLPVSGIFVSAIVKVSQKYFMEQRVYLGKVNGKVEEAFSGQEVVKAFNREGEEQREFGELNRALYQSAWKSQFLSGFMYPVMGLVGNLGYVAVAISGSILAVRRVITVGDIQAFIQYVKNFNQPIQMIAQISSQLQNAAAAAKRVFAFLDEEEESQCPEEAEKGASYPENVQTGQELRIQVPAASAGRKFAFPDLQSRSQAIGNVCFSHVKFGYKPDKIIISDFSCEVKQGQKVAIVGPTGAGKTTMVKLLMRFYDVLGGAILVDGRDIRSVSRGELRDSISMVLQDTWLFHGTIMENIRYGRLDATDEEVIAAAEAAYAGHFIRTLPGGYQMELDENAGNISQGQKQLLTIARAILADRPILILDEATSSVDTRTEIRIQKAMERLQENRTSFVIAHRLSTIRDADVILVMKNGDIVEQGNHEALMREKGFYYELYQSQFA